MAERIYNISIAGCGKVAHLHAKAIQSIPNACLAGVWSRTPKTAEDFALVYKTRSYSDISRMITDNNVDLVVVCTPHPFHKQPAEEAAKAGANVLVEVDDTAVAIVKFKSGAIGNILVSNSQKPGIFGKVHVHGENGASAGVQTDGGAMFIAGRSGVAEPPVNDLWTIPGEENLLKEWIKQDTETFNNCDPTVRYIQYQIEDFITAIKNNTEPFVTGEAGRRTVELFTAIYRSTRDNMPVKFPLKPEP